MKEDLKLLVKLGIWAAHVVPFLLPPENQGLTLMMEIDQN